MYAHESATGGRASELQSMLLQNDADPCRPCIGGNMDGDVLFDSIICGGVLLVFSNACHLVRKANVDGTSATVPFGMP